MLAKHTNNILHKCRTSKKARSTRFNILKKPSVHSVCGLGKSLACLSRDFEVKIFNLKLPNLQLVLVCSELYWIIIFYFDVKKLTGDNLDC